MANKKQEVETPLHEKVIMTNQLAAIVGKTSRWINQLSREGVFKQVGRGKFILGQSIQDYIEHLLGGKEDDKKPKLIDYKTEHERAKAEKAALELELLKDNLHKADDVERLLSNLILTTKSRLLGVPSRIATECEQESAEVVESIVRREIETALASLAKYTPDKIGGELDHGSPEDS
jgi:phage terminase Nu1 subunit (DNA packaging protein)